MLTILEGKKNGALGKNPVPLGKFIQFMKTNMGIAIIITKVKIVIKFTCLISLSPVIFQVFHTSHLILFGKSNPNAFKT